MDKKTEEWIAQGRENIQHMATETDQKRTTQYIDYVEFVNTEFPGLVTVDEAQAALMSALMMLAPDEVVEAALAKAKEEYIPRIANDPARHIQRLLNSVFG